MRVSPATRQRGLRLDVQGLRALSVVGVVANHAFSWPVGGFLGVDVFFVLSGFLITGLLLRDIERTGHLSFARFYSHRARRILPNALLVLVATVVAASVILPAARFYSVAADAAWASIFGANIHFLAEGTNYFSAAGPPSPLQHFWSLGVEEQFYLVWPLLLLFAAVVAFRTGRADSLGAIASGTVLVVVLASFSWAIIATANSPTAAYFSPATRAWELGVGALLSVSGPALERLPPSLRPVIAWAGLSVIVASVLLVPGTAGVPVPAAVPAVVGTALILAANAPANTLWPLTNRAMVRLGDLSYSVYLWHLPVLVLGATLLPTGLASSAVLIGASLLLAVAAYIGVEQPMRSRSGNMTIRAVRTAGASAVLLILVATGVPLFAVTVVAARTPAVAAASSEPSAVASPSATVGIPSAGPTSSPAPEPVVLLSAQIRAALRASTWPALRPDVPTIGLAARVPEWTKDGCLVVTPRNEAHCQWGGAGASRSAIVLGDSVALSWVPAIRAALEPHGFSVQALTMAQCPAAAVQVTDVSGSTGFASQCTAHNDWTIAEVRHLAPQLVILASSSTSELRIIGATGTAAEAQAFRTGQAKLIRRLPSGSHAVVLDGPPREDSLLDCYSRTSPPANCVTPVPLTFAAFSRDETAGAHAAGASHIAVRSWFCTSGRCPAFVGQNAVFADGEHLTEAYSKRLGPVLAAALVHDGVDLITSPH